MSSSINSVEQMQAILEHERARADRSNGFFSIIVFRSENRRKGRAALKRAAKILKQRLRFTDQVGWLSDRRLGALLCDTSATDGRQLGDSIYSDLGDDRHVLSMELYTYPTDTTSQTAHEAETVPASTEKEETVGAGTLDPLFSRGLPGWKRVMDIVLSAVGLTMLLPLLLVVGVAIKLTSSGPVLFKQWRSGLGGRPFEIFKFRTMVVDAEAKKKELLAKSEQDGPAFKIKNDPRITKLGAFLRKTSIDELPQLWNVLIGDMTLVGPRPLPCGETAGCSGWHRMRLNVTPGLTCIWQVEGRSRVTFDEWVQMDVRYSRSRSILGDLKLLVRTVRVVLLQRGAC